ncbi:hypothetical protein CAPTEDRAFT_97007 [Capitella teleta]|uniref:G-protein coupled receptors family 1 profile domain-containing protein n=1 Tax=Capitella teleta TaxID=283909 RepID=R7TL27_CAPTE|nr:hypothetical protein CAPTEDRAFT_97007 [Capitella teleta]|eukprot:ELT92261.1 hypothetical protein CAPTEDRAFT_97007 [Capitella teleta]
MDCSEALIACGDPYHGLPLNETANTSDSNFEVPRELLFNTDAIVSVSILGVMFLVAAVGNLTVFAILFFNRHSRLSRVSIFIMHLSISDLIITFIMIPMEIGWHVTVAWKAGDVGCRVLLFFRAFGFYLGSFILVAISLDRYLSITKPLSLVDAGKRGRIMLRFSWLFAFVAAIPQSIIFHVEQHPIHTWFSQCVTFNFFPSDQHEMAYNVSTVCMMYVVPLLLITACYSLILREVSKKTSSTRTVSGGQCRVRMSGNGRLKMAKARTNTLRMTIVIVLVFVICWSPYFCMLLVWWIDRGQAVKVPPKLQRAIFIFAVSNSCVNPFVYGTCSHIYINGASMSTSMKPRYSNVCLN